MDLITELETTSWTLEEKKREKFVDFWPGPYILHPFEKRELVWLGACVPNYYFWLGAPILSLAGAWPKMDKAVERQPRPSHNE